MIQVKNIQLTDAAPWRAKPWLVDLRLYDPEQGTIKIGDGGAYAWKWDKVATKDFDTMDEAIEWVEEFLTERFSK